MADIALGNRSEASGRYNFVRGVDGDVSFDDTEAHAVMTSVIEHKGTYWADSGHGSDLHTLKSLSSRTPSQAEAMTLEALQPLEQARLIDAAATRATATVVRGALGRLDVDVEWKSTAGSSGSETAGI